MIQLMRFLNLLVTIYIAIIFIRIILTWFSWERNSGVLDILSRITDPYLNWFRRFGFLRAGSIDFSPVAALGVLSLINLILSNLAFYGTITIGIILVMALQTAWGLVSFVLGFLIVILILRLISSLARWGGSNPLWHIVNNISQPVIYRISRILFKDRIVNLRTGIIISAVCLAVIYLILRILVFFLSGILAGLPI